MTGLRLAFVLSVIVSLAACAGPPLSHADAARQAACRDRADSVYLQRNRAELFQADQYASSTRDSPYGAAGGPATPAAGLSGRYDRDTLLRNCLDATGGGTAGSSPAAPTPGPSFRPPPAEPLAAPPVH